MTPFQFSLAVQGYNEERERQTDILHHLFAFNAAVIANSSGNLKKPLTVEKLVGKKKQKQTKSKEERRKELNDLLKKFGKEELPPENKTGR